MVTKPKFPTKYFDEPKSLWLIDFCREPVVGVHCTVGTVAENRRGSFNRLGDDNIHRLTGHRIELAENMRNHIRPVLDDATVSDYFCDIIPALALKKRTGAKWIAWIHHCETDPKVRPGNRLVNELTFRMQRWSFKRIVAHADAAWINDTLAGDEIERRLLALGMPKAKIRRMQNGIDLSAITSAKPQHHNTLTPQHRSPDAVMIGVRPNKGLHDIIPIWERVRKLRPGTTLTLMGGMSGEAEVVKEIAASDSAAL